MEELIQQLKIMGGKIVRSQDATMQEIGMARMMGYSAYVNGFEFIWLAS